MGTAILEIEGKKFFVEYEVEKGCKNVAMEWGKPLEEPTETFAYPVKVEQKTPKGFYPCKSDSVWEEVYNKINEEEI